MQPTDENAQDPQVEQRIFREDHELDDGDEQNIKHNSFVQELESGLAAAIQIGGANGGNPDTPATPGSSGAGTPVTPG